MLREAKKWALIQPIRRKYWEKLTPDRQWKLIAEILVTSALSSPKVAAVLTATFQYEVIDPVEVDGQKMPIKFGHMEFDAEHWVVIRTEAQAIPSGGEG
ncbi:hypothetical protein [Mycobacteroides salmoniphilum]|uniref:hypothetical protein n=1 Tax=Mycobacteroides salmoniphilum TaxID=404941 RepID=UPI00099320C3|nr:hypothetical protein [Mycobacteroides salmoniphilum]